MRRGAWGRRVGVANVAVLMAGMLVGCAEAGVADAPGAANDLLRGHDWAHFAGAEQRADGVRISALDRKIVRQNGSGGQSDPPVNLLGPRLRGEGNFQVTATMAGVGERGAYLQMYSGVPVIYGEWRYEPPSLRVGIVEGRLQVAVWDGRSDRPTQTRTFGANLAGTVAITVRTNGNSAVLSIDGKEVGSVPDGDIFDGVSVWFGADAELGGDWTLTGLTARAEPGAKLTVENSPGLQQKSADKSLRAAAARLVRPIEMAAALASGPLLADEAYRGFAAAQYGMLSPGNDMTPQFVQPRRGVFAFAEGDLLVDFARANGMKVHGRPLVWHEGLAQWMREVQGAEAVRQTMLDHIGAVAGHYRGKVTAWDVVNEPISDDPADYANGGNGIRRARNIWYQAMGEQYIDEAFRRAREIDPGARLYLDDYGLEEDGPRWDALLALVTRLRERGVPIDGVGFQSHEYTVGDRASAETFRKHVRALSELGLQVRISEMDVLVDSDERAVQTRQFAQRLAVCREEPNCTGFATWGFTDRYGSTTTPGQYPPATADALPVDAQLRPKPAYSAMLDVLTR